MAFVAAHPEKAVLEAAALQVGLEFPVDMVRAGICPAGPVGPPGQGSALRRAGRVVSARVDGARRWCGQMHVHKQGRPSLPGDAILT